MWKDSTRINSKIFNTSINNYILLYRILYQKSSASQMLNWNQMKGMIENQLRIWHSLKLWAGSCHVTHHVLLSATNEHNSSVMKEAVSEIMKYPGFSYDKKLVERKPKHHIFKFLYFLYKELSNDLMSIKGEGWKWVKRELNMKRQY